jgi:transcriptional regulator with XRE-family HTH domain
MELQAYQLIRLKRESLGMTQEVLAENIGMNPSAYAKIEQGTTQITIDRLKQIAKGLQTSMSELLGEDGKGNVINNNNFKDFYNQTGIIQASFENERSAYLSQIESLKNMVDFLQKQLEKGS